jgi:hypothetical protein
VRAARALLALLALAGAAVAQAHKPSDAYLALSVDASGISGQWDIALRDLDFALGLDGDGDGRITWGELRARQPAIASYALARLGLRADGATCTLRPTAHLADTHSDGAYEVLRFVADCPAHPASLEVDYRLFADLDPQHKGLLRLSTGGRTRTAVFGSGRAQQRFELAGTGRAGQLLAYVHEGVLHIFGGYDHILFLLSLLLPAVLVRATGSWRGVATLRQAFLEVLKVVTAFTLAHSLTLSLAALGVVSLPSRLVESAIAASVVIAAAGNLLPYAERRRWLIAFAFGLIHGFGFAAVLTDLALPRPLLLLALLGFNAGVELGQLAIVAVFLPLAFALRGTWFYRRAALVGGSLAIVLVAAVWLIERAFDVKL